MHSLMNTKNELNLQLCPTIVCIHINVGTEEQLCSCCNSADSPTFCSAWLTLSNTSANITQINWEGHTRWMATFSSESATVNTNLGKVVVVGESVTKLRLKWKPLCQNCLPPVTNEHLMCFHGMVVHYRFFILGFSDYSSTVDGYSIGSVKRKQCTCVSYVSVLTDVVS